ncbi:PTS system, lactose-specific IIA component [Atopostipes suicloacalis DSM 15692]|uniref:PTS system lactose-specific EIIA component n=1 Tax=Atopostipes suicloacalis DSM 15692 TaxID=1121025 RepID=A0A1M4UJX4_9LACT|nr:PTS lactose/cellobiose transporter subunit IIA [Atopostipes suicloacalis]SHE56863.1 PTS system, lactose-specific IIA component [Atopostipes suicloacalis DSM 15692]
MNKEEVAMVGFEIVAYSGEARSKFLNAINNLKDGGSMEESEKLIKEGEASLTKAHKSQTELLAKEASGENIELGFIFVHGQDHLMTTVMLKDILQHLLNIYRNEE